VFRRASLRLGTIKSIEINVNVTWLVVFGLLIYWLRTGYIAEEAPEMGSATGWLVSAVAALVLFGSVLAHELAHSLVALRQGLPIRRITLFIFGGIAQMEREPARPGVEFRMAVAGPLLSLMLAGGFTFIRFVLLKASPASGPGLITQYAAYANFVLAGFNLVPGYPLDGGRVFRALIWKVTGDFVKATAIAGTVGRIFGLMLAFIGMMLAVAVGAPGFLWLVFIGTFLERLAFVSIYRVRLMHGRHEVETRTAPGLASTTPYPEYYTNHTGWPGMRA
jgi:Zn-dependent protease